MIVMTPLKKLTKKIKFVCGIEMNLDLEYTKHT